LRKFGRSRPATNSMNFDGILMQNQRDTVSAKKRFEDARAIFRAIGNRLGVMNLCGHSPLRNPKNVGPDFQSRSTSRLWGLRATVQGKGSLPRGRIVAAIAMTPAPRSREKAARRSNPHVQAQSSRTSAWPRIPGIARNTHCLDNPVPRAPRRRCSSRGWLRFV